MEQEKAYLKVEGMVYDAGNETDLINLANADGFEQYETVEQLQPGDRVFVTEDFSVQVAGKNEETGEPMFLVPADFKIYLSTCSQETNERLERIGIGLSEE